MSGMLLKSKGEEAAANLKVEDDSEDSIEDPNYDNADMDDRDELGDLLGDEEVDQLLLDNEGFDFSQSRLAALLDENSLRGNRMSYLDERTSLLDLDFDKDEFDYDPFQMHLTRE
jgi:hypothetical protein